jgi:hypothetical protein
VLQEGVISVYLTNTALWFSGLLASTLLLCVDSLSDHLSDFHTPAGVAKFVNTCLDLEICYSWPSVLHICLSGRDGMYFKYQHM